MTVSATMGKRATAAKATVSFDCRRTAQLTTRNGGASFRRASARRADPELLYCRIAEICLRDLSALEPMGVGPVDATGGVDAQAAQLGRGIQARGTMEERHDAGGLDVDGGRSGAGEGGAGGGGIDGGDEGERSQRRVG